MDLLIIVLTVNLSNLLIFWEFILKRKGGAVAKNNEVIKLNNSSRQVVADKIDENLEKTLDFSQSNIIGSEALKELKKSSTNEDNETSENILVPLK